MFFWNSFLFSLFHVLMDVSNLISGSSTFSKTSLNIWKFTVHILLKPGLENFQHYFDSMWDECNCAVVWHILWHLLSSGLKWKLTFSSSVATPEFSKFAGILSAELCTTSSFRIWNSSTGIPSPPLALFVLMLPKAHLTLQSRMSDCRWVITPSWLSGSLRYFLYSSSLFLPPFLNIFCFCHFHTVSVLYCAHLCMKCSLAISNFLEEISSLSHSIIFLYFLHWSLRKALSLLAILWNSALK